MKIIRKKTSLEISDIHSCVIDAATFTYRYKSQKKVQFFSKKTGQMVEKFVDDRILSEQVDLFYIENDKMFTYAGLKEKIVSSLIENNIEFDYEVKVDLPMKPTLSGDVLSGLHADQQEAVMTALDSETGCLIEAATGSGKTYIIAGLCRAFKDHKGLIVTNRQSVATRLYDSLKDLCPENNIGIYISTKKIPGRTTIITAATLDRIDPKSIGFLIFDECHAASGEKRSADILRFYNAYKYGLSATIENSFSNSHHYLEAIFGPVKYQLSDPETEALGRVVPLDVYIMDVEQGISSDLKSNDLDLERFGIWYNKTRNQVAKRCCDLVPDNQQLIVFVRTEYHLNFLKKHFLKDYESYHTGMSVKEKRRVLEGFNSGEIKRIISTDCLAEGVDPKNLFVAINLNWTQSDVSVLQKAGRNRRLADGKSHGVVIDFNDAWDEKFRRKATNRINKYKKRDYNVIENVSPESIRFVQNV